LRSAKADRHEMDGADSDGFIGELAGSSPLVSTKGM